MSAPPSDALAATRDAAATGRWWVLAAVGLSTLMSAIDSSGVLLALPAIREAFDAEVAAVQWVLVVFLLMVSALLLAFGRLGDLRGTRTVYLAGFGIFLLGALGGGLAPTVGVLVAARGVQAVGAAMLFATGTAILTNAFPPAQRGRVLGLQATMTYLGLTVGPSLGGVLIGAFGWRVVFFASVPVGLIGMALGARAIAPDRPRGEGATAVEPFDLIGAALFAVGLTALLLALNRGSAWGWSSPAVLALLLAAAVLLVAFYRQERRSASPMLDLSLFGRRIFSAATLSAVLSYMAGSGAGFVMPFYLLQARGVDPEMAGLILSGQSALMAVTAPLAGALSDRIGARAPATLGLLLVAAAFGGVSQLPPTAPLVSVALLLALVGLGTGLFTSPNGADLMGAAPRERRGVASGMLALARNVGQVLGVGVAGAVVASYATSELLAAASTALAVSALIALVASIVSCARGRRDPA